ncbi:MULTISPECIES: hypothetical protein [unclassified Ruegeria]|uniref:hypothetical protein n=1 Tax=unclassified Ruegeria TaxID=2625375 RepID=UPI001491F572|nr:MULTISPECIES: hypothetical protein [unclassified Ruegeria]NOD36554.1 hypothetical protein [Ruegeria sp. HKCCD7296]NOE43794.1 hypothetical protein [Ruegeria sp. HKCCD7319]
MRVIIFLVLSVFLPTAAFAYVGPGAGLGAIGILIALIGAILLAVIGFIWYPLKRLLKKRQTPEENTDGNNASLKD